MSDTKARLREQAKRRKAEAKRNAGFLARYSGQGAKGLSNLLRDLIMYRGHGRTEIPSKRRRSGYTRNTGNGVVRTHKQQRKVALAPATPYRVVLHRPGRWPRVVIATDDQTAASIAYKSAVARYGSENLERIGFGEKAAA